MSLLLVQKILLSNMNFSWFFSVCFTLHSRSLLIFLKIFWPHHRACACMGAQLLQSCPTLCDPMDYSPPGSSVHGILQSRILEWVATPSCRGSSWPRDWTRISCVSSIAGRFFTTKPPGKPHHRACGILIHQPGMEPPVAPALGAQSLNHWTTRKVPAAPYSYLCSHL